MKPGEFLDRIESLLVPSQYTTKLVAAVPDGWRVYRKGAYMFAAVPYSDVPAGDYGNAHVKSALGKMVFAFPFFAEKGLFLLHHGPQDSWKKHAAQHRVDRTALRPIITQSIHFVDTETGVNVNSRTQWGPVKFGFCGGVIDLVETACNDITIEAGAQPEMTVKSRGEAAC